MVETSWAGEVLKFLLFLCAKTFYTDIMYRKSIQISCIENGTLKYVCINIEVQDLKVNNKFIRHDDSKTLGIRREQDLVPVISRVTHDEPSIFQALCDCVLLDTNIHSRSQLLVKVRVKMGNHL